MFVIINRFLRLVISLKIPFFVIQNQVRNLTKCSIQNTLFLVMIDDREFIMLIGIECEIG